MQRALTRGDTRVASADDANRAGAKDGAEPDGVNRAVAEGDGARRDERLRRERARQQQKAELMARRAEITAAKRRAEAEGAERQRVEAARQTAERRSADLTGARAYAIYVDVRERVRAMRPTGGSPGSSLTSAETQMVSRLAHLWQASPETVACLRRFCEPITGVCASDYDAPSPELTRRLKRGYQLLRRQAGADLFVEEPSALGGFGVVRSGERFNEDTLRFLGAMVALDDGAVLDGLRAGSARRLVWEIGGGWGGFARQFKTVCPNVTYLITGIPDVLLVSAVYLMTVFPQASCRFHGDASRDLWADWAEVDFVFAPESAVPVLRPPQVDLVLDVMALRDMSPDRVQCHVQRAYTLGARYVFSLLPAPLREEDVATVWKSIERLYWPHPVPPRAEHLPPVVEGVPAAVPGVEYAHLMGWRRLRA